jgi:Family of unknown function (DUF6194)
MTESEIIELVTAMPGVAAVTASEANGAPEVAWGDTFFFYDPEGPGPHERRMPFATIVRNDYDGFDTRSDLGRPGVFRVNIAVGGERFEELVGYAPAAHERHRDEFDYAALDRLLPHPVYAPQAWVAIVKPGERTGALARTLLAEARDRARRSHERARTARPG